MARLDEDGLRYRCDKCGVEYEGGWEYDDDAEGFNFDDFMRSLFYRRPQPTLPDFCHACAVKIIPLISHLRDIDELNLYINRLKGAVNEKRKLTTQNHGAAADDARQCG